MSKELIDRKQIHYVWAVDADGEEHDGVTLQSIIKKCQLLMLLRLSVVQSANIITTLCVALYGTEH